MIDETRQNGERRDHPFEPRYPTLAACGLLAIWIALLSLPMWAGKFLAGPFSDQYDTGYAFRHWLATEFRRTGSIPLWNPELFGGMPFVAAMHGDIFYPTSWLRLMMPTGPAMSIGFVLHYFLAGLFVYLLLRLLKVSWAGAVAGGCAYHLSGVIGSYVQPGHDGKLFVTTLLPLALIGLVLGMRDRRAEGYGILALAVGLALLSPHAQMSYYLLVAAGIFALYLAFGETEARPLQDRLGGLALALAAVIVGFGVGMIQLLPFYHYIPFSPRAEGYYGFEGSTSYAIPWAHIPEFFIAGFTGRTPSATYWGPNPLKLHSEYLGLPVIALAIVGVAGPRRRLVAWLGGIGLLFLLICLGAATPFYRVWWAVMPFVRQTRAPGMALFVVALILALFAGLGVDRLERRATRPWAVAWLVAGAVVALLGAVGLFGSLATSLAQGVQMAQGRDTTSAARAAQSAIRAGAVVGGAALILLGLVQLGWQGRRLPPWLFALAVPLLLGADLWRNARGFWTYTSAPEQSLYAGDEVTRLLQASPLPYRVLNLPGQAAAYPGSSLMAFGIPQLLGYHGNELHAFDELAGGKNRWANLGNPKLWDLYAIRFALLPANAGLPDSLPGFVNRRSGVQTSAGTTVNVLERVPTPPYAWLAAAALKLPDSVAVGATLDSRIHPAQIVVLAEDASVTPAPIDTLPVPPAVAVSVIAWEPGRMTLALDPAAPKDAYVVVAENYYPDWQATVDGRAARVERGNVAELVVPVPAGAREVSLAFSSAAYRLGRGVTLASLLLVVAGLAGPPAIRRRRG